MEKRRRYLMRTDGNSSRRQTPGATARGATYIIDLTHFLDENGLPPVGAPKQLLRALAFFGSIVEAASSHPAGTHFPSAIPCRRRPCSRRGLTITNGRDGVIRWGCPERGENGCISKWQGTDYDLTGAMEPDMGRRVGVHVSAEEHRVLSEAITNSQEEEAIVAGGVVTPAGIWISGRLEDFEELLGSIAAEANHTSSTKRRRALHAICDRVEEMVAELAPE